MSEIEVGEYIRTDKGIIVEIDSGVDLDMVEFENAIIGNIKSHSKNIIDLIEVGDIVEIVIFIFDYEKEKYKDSIKTTKWYVDEFILECIKNLYKNKKIKLISILSSESFNRHCFKTKEDYRYE